MTIRDYYHELFGFDNSSSEDEEDNVHISVVPDQDGDEDLWTHLFGTRSTPEIRDGLNRELKNPCTVPPTESVSLHLASLSNHKHVDTEPLQPIPGLFLFTDLLSRTTQHLLLHALRESGHFANGRNQTVRFGKAEAGLEWLDRFLEEKVFDRVSTFEKGHARREGLLFNHGIVNLYAPGEGLKEHVDLARFMDGIVGVSLGGQCDILFRRTENATGDRDELTRLKIPSKDMSTGPESIRIHLRPGDVYFMTGESRYRYTHGIPAESMNNWRVSVTLRKLVPGWEESVETVQEPEEI